MGKGAWLKGNGQTDKQAFQMAMGKLMAERRKVSNLSIVAESYEAEIKELKASLEEANDIIARFIVDTRALEEENKELMDRLDKMSSVSKYEGWDS